MAKRACNSKSNTKRCGGREGIVWRERRKGAGGGGGGGGVLDPFSLEAGRYRYSLQGWPKRVRVASSGVQYKEES